MKKITAVRIVRHQEIVASVGAGVGMSNCILKMFGLSFNHTHIVLQIFRRDFPIDVAHIDTRTGHFFTIKSLYSKTDHEGHSFDCSDKSVVIKPLCIYIYIYMYSGTLVAKKLRKRHMYA